MSGSAGPEAERGLRYCLSLPDFDAVTAALRALIPQLRAADVPLLAGLLRSEDRAVREAAIAAASKLGDLALADPVAACLDAATPDERMQAAIALGAMRATRLASRLADGLAAETGQAFGAFAAGIELLGSRDVVPRLVDLLRTAPDAKVWDLTHARWILTGVDPVSQDSSRPGDSTAAVRTAWLEAAAAGELTAPPAPEIRAPRQLDRNLADFHLAFGRGVLRIDFAPASPGTNWPGGRGRC